MDNPVHGTLLLHIMNTHHCHYRDLCLGHQWAHRRSCRGSSCWDTPGSPRAAGCRGSCTGSSCSSSCCGSGSGSCYTQSPPGTAAACKRCFPSRIGSSSAILTSGTSYTLMSVEKSHRFDSRSTIFFTVLKKAC